MKSEKGYGPSYPTSKNLDDLLIGLSGGQCYPTSLFPFIKFDLLYCARTFTMNEMKIMNFKMIICLD